MGIEVAVATASLVISLALTTYSLLAANKGAGDNLSPQSLDGFNITQAREGSAIPLTYGTRRVTGNIIYYGGFKSVPIKTEAPGGKGGGGGEVVSGFKNFLDIWQSVGIGKLELVKIFVENKEVDLDDIEATSIDTNDGTQANFPTEPGADANAIKGVAHIFFKQLFLGENSQNAPTIHYVVKRILTTGIPHENMEDGSNNPAAIVYDLIVSAGWPTNRINLQSFYDAAEFWNDKGYGLNLEFNQQDEVGEMINKVLSFIDGTVFIDQQGKISIKAFDPNESAVATLTTEDFDDFSIRRVSEDQLPNDFKATYIDEEQEFTQRTVVTQNQALINKVANIKNKSIDFTGFKSLETASKRLIELMKVSTYPAAEIDFTTASLAQSVRVPGEIIEVSNTDLGITNASFRITAIDNANINKNNVRIKATQVVETLFDDNFFVVGGTQQQRPDLSLQAFENIRVFELPYNKQTEFEPAFLLLVQRRLQIETGYSLLFSSESDQDFTFFNNFSNFSLRGTLTQEYPLTKSIDETVSIFFECTLFDPEFTPISEKQLYQLTRFAIIGNEIIAFRDIEALGENQYKLTGNIRGVLGTAPSVHNAESEVWLTNIGDNVLQGINLEEFYLKMLPIFQSTVFPPDTVTAVEVNTTNKAKQPRNPARLEATRTGSTVNIQIYPNSPDIDGNGQGIPANSAPGIAPYPFTGDFIFEYNSTQEIINSDQHVVTLAGDFDLTVKSRRFGLESTGLTLAIGSVNDKYKTTN